MATGVATKMKNLFGEAIDLHIHLIDAPEAANYVLRGATTVFLNEEWVPLDTATSADRMQEFLEQALRREGGA
uniref:Uncharacterized protein n=1 Tax=Geobacter sp. (strain M21) TaxID=443144 RepID=C6E9I7_GEOSM